MEGKWYVRQTKLIRCVLASLYEGLSVRPSIRPSVRPSVRLSVRGSVRPAFFLITEIDKKHYRIIGKVETLFLDCNNLQKSFKTNF